MIEGLVRVFLENEFAQAGILTVVTGGIIHAARTVPSRIGAFIKARICSRFVIEDSEDLYGAFSAWAVVNLRMWAPESFAAPNDFSSDRASHSECVSQSCGPQVNTRGTLIPVSATMYGFHKGAFILATASRRNVEFPSGNGKSYVNTLEISIAPGGENRLREFVKSIASAEVARRRDERTVPLYRMVHCSWRACGDVLPRDPQTVVLREGQMQALIDDASRYLKRKEWYAKRGLPWRRGYLFYGPPGNGKTSACLGLAAALKSPLYAIQLASVYDDNTLVDLFSNVVEGGVICLEDVDCLNISKSREETSGGTHPQERRGVTLSGLLNAIDGVGASEGRIVIMTTNHPENLDPALIRSGRVDVRYEFPNADAGQVRALAALFGATISDAEVEALSGKSMAEVQEFLMAHETSP